jgi:DNA-binding NtrC family response regulator
VHVKPHLLIVDDDPLIGESLSFALEPDFEVAVADSRAAAMKLLKSGQFMPTLALIDLGLPPLPNLPTEGFRLVGDLLAFSPHIRVLVLTGQNEAANGRRARALGATELVPKPCDPGHLKRQLLAALKGQRDENSVLHESQQHDLIGDSVPMQKLRAQIDTYAASMYPTLIEGESGSGKERVAAALHHLSARSKQPFFALNCAAISANLVEPTLFGYAKGAFTGAANTTAGYFEDAGEGTLFLDEIGELPLELQPKLLRVLENGEFQRVGETQTRKSKARVLAATNRDLKAEVKAGRFRADLFHRLSVFAIQVPPLSMLGDDKLKLMAHYRALFSAQNALQNSAAPNGAHVQPFALDDRARAAWLAYGFPGNVRELKNIVIRLTAKYSGYVVGEDELLQEFDAPDGGRGGQVSDVQVFNPRADIESAVAECAAFSLDEKLAQLELQYIDAAITLSQGNMTQAAKLLGLSRSTLYSRLEVLRPSQLQR